MTEARIREHRQERIDAIKCLGVISITVLSAVFLFFCFRYAFEMEAW